MKQDGPEKLAEPWLTRIRKHPAAVLKSLLPKRILQEIQRYRSYKRAERPLYLKFRMLGCLPFGRKSTRLVPQGVRSFVFVCHGNIMRSPICEALFRRLLNRSGCQEMRVTSAGLHATPGKPAHPWALVAARELGISLDHHRARSLTGEMVENADAIFAMDYHNRIDLLSRYPNARSKIFMLGDYAANGRRSSEIPDPFFGDEEETRRCYRIIQKCLHNLASRVSRVTR